VRFRGQSVSTKADATGGWRLNLAPLEACATPQTLTVEGSSQIELTNILVGDVWLISGQSNADWPLRSAAGSHAAIDTATNTLVRFLHLAEAPVTTAKAWTPEELAKLNPQDYFSGVWQVADPSNVGTVSAVGFFFVREIQTTQKVPVGLIDCTVGGTMALNWIPRDVIRTDARLADMADHFLESDAVPLFAKTRLCQNLAAWDAAGRQEPMPEHPYKPGACWQNGLATIAPFALRGVLWYQGETDADFYEAAAFEAMATRYTVTFKLLASAWRAAWENAALPIYSVQLPRMNRPSWPWFRESQLICSRAISNTAMSVSFEYGEPGNVHPIDKAPVAARLALIARAQVYRESIEWSGPQLRGWSIEGSKVQLHFDHAESGLVSSDGRSLRLFSVAGADHRFFPASVTITNASLMVHAPQVPQPVAVRYAWVPSGDINFYNGAGLPASPFRTDSWTTEEAPQKSE
jgi:sialate O-acetylesterase